MIWKPAEWVTGDKKVPDMCGMHPTTTLDNAFFDQVVLGAVLVMVLVLLVLVLMKLPLFLHVMAR